MKKISVIIGFFAAQLLLNNAFAGGEKHDFTGEVWAQDRSCTVCHSLKDNLPKVVPADSRVIDLLKLTDLEKAAYEVNSNNVLCLVCHQPDRHSTIMPKTSSGAPGALPSPNVPPGFSSGSEGSVNLRVINRGGNNLECLKCHDLHNKDSDKMLKPDYWQAPLTP